MEEELPVDIFRRIVSFSTNSRTILNLWEVNEAAQATIKKEIKNLSKKSAIPLDIRQLFSESNPFQWEFFDFENKEHKKRLHDKIRVLARLLERLLMTGNTFQIENLNAAALGFQAELDEQYLPRAPFMLQKKLMHILSNFQSSSISISSVFMRPSRMIRTFRDRFDQITTLDLGNMKALAACQLRSQVLPSLVNLENFKWSHANYSILHKIPRKENLKSLDLTFHIIGRPRFAEFNFLKEFVNLKKLYLGFTVPHKPSRMEMDVLLNLYQAIWSRKMGNLLENYPKVTEIGLWNVPEKIFQQLSKRGLPVETLNFGAINQSLTKLCSFDSVLQAFFKFEELEHALEPPVIRNLNMNLHTMPAVGLDYYLPNLMNRVNQLPDLRTVSLFFKCIFHAQMTSSWSMETKKEKSSRRRPVIDAQYTKFELHSEGLCGLIDLDRQLPPSLESCSISLNLPAENGLKVIPSVMEFIEKLGSFNDFPELVEFHIQILGVKCFEKLAHKIGDHLGSHLRRVSIYAPLKFTEKEKAKRLMTRIAELFPRATEISLSTDLFKILLSEKSLSSPQWPQRIAKLARKHEFDMEKCKITTGKLPRNLSFVCKGEEPIDLTEEEEERIIEELEETVMDGGVDMLEDNDWITDEDQEEEQDDGLENTTIVYESEEDELDDLERKLEKESDRRHSKWQKKQNRVAAFSDESENDDGDDDKENQEEEDHEDVVDWDKLSEDGEEEEGEEQDDGNRHGMIDDEAIESEGETIEDEEEDEEEEEDLESVDDSDDERLFENGPSRKRQVERQQLNAKRRKIVISDDEDEE